MTRTTAQTVCRLRAGDVMTSPPVSVGPAANLWTAWTVMMHQGLRHLLVAADGRCVGIIDDRALFAQWPMGPLALRRTSVGSIMRTQTASVRPETDIATVAFAMVADGIDAVPVVDSAGELVGIVTGGDITTAVACYGVCKPEGDSD